MPHIFRFKNFKKLKRKKKINHWIFKVLNTDDFYNSKEFNTWGLCSKGTYSELFMKKVKNGDKLWFINKKKQIFCVANYKHHNKRLFGPLINLTKTNEELGWANMNKVNIEIHYENLKDIEDKNLKYHFDFISQVILNDVSSSHMNMEHEYEKLDF